MSICRWIGRWQVPTWMPPHQGLTLLLAWGGNSFFVQSFCILYQTNKGVMFGDTFSYFSLFAFFIQNRYRGQVRGFFFLCQWFWLFASWDLFVRPGSPRSPKMPLARKWRRSLRSTLSTWPGGIRELKEWLHSFFFFLFFWSTYPNWGLSEGEIYHFLST